MGDIRVLGHCLILLPCYASRGEVLRLHEYSFDAFCKKAIRNFAVDAKRIYWKKTTVTSDEDLWASYVKSLMTEDSYNLNKYEKIYYVNGVKVVVTNETEYAATDGAY